MGSKQPIHAPGAIGPLLDGVLIAPCTRLLMCETFNVSDAPARVLKLAECQV